MMGAIVRMLSHHEKSILTVRSIPFQPARRHAGWWLSVMARCCCCCYHTAIARCLCLARATGASARTHFYKYMCAHEESSRSNFIFGVANKQFYQVGTRMQSVNDSATQTKF